MAGAAAWVALPNGRPQGDPRPRFEVHVSARSDRSSLSFAKPMDHPKWDPRSSGGDELKQTRRYEIATQHLSSGKIGECSPGHQLSKAASKMGHRKTRLDLFAGPVRALEMNTHNHNTTFQGAATCLLPRHCFCRSDEPHMPPFFFFFFFFALKLSFF